MGKNDTAEEVLCQLLLAFLEKNSIIYKVCRLSRTWGETLRRALPLTGKGLIFIVVGLLLVGWLLNTPAGLLGKADAIGYAVCHRIDVRSFHLGERQMPLCARCTGMYLGAMLGLVFQALTGKRRAGMPPWRVIVFLGALVLAFGVDGVNSYLHLFPGAPALYEPSNLLRLLTGTGMGLVIALVLYPAFNQAVWQVVDPTPAVGGLRHFPAHPWPGSGAGLAGVDRKSSVIISRSPWSARRACWCS